MLVSQADFQRFEKRCSVYFQKDKVFLKRRDSKSEFELSRKSGDNYSEIIRRVAPAAGPRITAGNPSIGRIAGDWGAEGAGQKADRARNERTCLRAHSKAASNGSSAGSTREKPKPARARTHLSAAAVVAAANSGVRAAYCAGAG